MLLWWPKAIFLKFGKPRKCNQDPSGNLASLGITSAGDTSAVEGVVWYRWKEEGLEMRGKSETIGLYRGRLRISGSGVNRSTIVRTKVSDSVPTSFGRNHTHFGHF